MVFFTAQKEVDGVVFSPQRGINDAYEEFIERLLTESISIKKIGFYRDKDSCFLAMIKYKSGEFGNINVNISDAKLHLDSYRYLSDRTRRAISRQRKLMARHIA